MEGAVESGRGHWSTAAGLTLVVLGLYVLDPLALVVLPLAILIVAIPAERRLVWVGVGLLLWLLAVLFTGGALPLLSRGWALLVGGSYLVVTLTKPAWDVTSRALTSVAAALAMVGIGLLISGQAPEVDAQIRSHFATILALVFRDLQAQIPDPARLAEVRANTERFLGDMFPALLALQSVAALALASWWVRRVGRSSSDAFRLARLRDFRFSDELIWVLIGAVVMLLLPLNTDLTRVGLNALAFMATLYAFRGLAVFIFLATGSRSIPTMVLGAFAFIFLYPVALTAALLMGVGDTWLDVRRRVATADPS